LGIGVGSPERAVAASSTDRTVAPGCDVTDEVVPLAGVLHSLGAPAGRLGGFPLLRCSVRSLPSAYAGVTMAVEERRRIALHRAAADTWGEEGADTLVELVVPLGGTSSRREPTSEP
jgi:hypothetical protein